MYVNQFIYSRERRRFGRQCLFTDRNELMLSVHPSVRLRLKYILRNPINQATQLSDQKALSIMETENVSFEPRGLNHYEGGWPKEVNINDEEQTLRHRKKVERDDNWGEQISNLIKRSMEVALQNNAINIYEDFFEDLPEDSEFDIRLRYEARSVNVFHDICTPARAIIDCDWAPNNQRLFMALHRYDAMQTGPSAIRVSVDAVLCTPNGFFIWDIRNPLRPRQLFDAPEVVTRAFICPKDDNFMAGGYDSGKVILWDAVAAGQPLRTCPLEAAHREEMSALCWVHSKSNTEFYTGSLDGSIKYWDGRDLKMPIQELLLEPDPQERQERNNAHGVMVLEFEYTIPVRYIMGSDMGHVFIGNRKGMTAPEAIVGNYQLFSGPIRTIQRNPFFVKNFLICGDWRARIWAEESKNSPSTIYFKRKYEVMCGAWSTARCSLFVMGDDKGHLEFWDLLLHQREPVYTLMFKSSITSITFRPDGEFMTVSQSNGDTHILELDEAMKTASSKEKALIAAMFEREMSRSKLLEARVEEIKLKRRTVQMAEEERLRRELDEDREPNIELDPDNPDQFVQMIESDAEFRQALQDFQVAIMAVDKRLVERQFLMERTDFEQYYMDYLDNPMLDEFSSDEIEN